MSKKRHKSKGTNNTSINHDSVMLSGEGDPDFEGDADGNFEGDVDGEDSDDDIDLFKEKRYEKTKAEKWTIHENGRPGRDIQAIPFTGPAEFFCPNLTGEELKGMFDVHGNIRFFEIFEWMLPTFGSVSFYEFLSARMHNLMLRNIQTKGWSPLHYQKERVICADDVARFFGCQLAWSLRGNPSIKQTWSTREFLDAIETCMECMPNNAFQDIYSCLHFDDHWDDNGWDDVYADETKCSPEGTAHHRRKFSMFEDGFNRRWKECVIFGCWLTFNESRVAGWYHSPITKGPDPKPIRTGATIHSLAITHGDLASYKVHVCVFGGATDGDLGKANDNTVTTQKWVNMLSLMLDSFKNNGHCVTMESPYMGDIMAMIGCNVWRINMVGTAQANLTGANVDCTKSMKKGTYGAICWQHTWRSLCFAVWSDNALIRTLSNFHGPVILKAGRGVLQKKRDDDKKRERMKAEVRCPAQTKNYCETFHLIDKGNGAEANYDLGGKSRLHNWSPKLTFWLAYKMYKALVKQHTPERRFLDMGDAMRELTHDLCQRGPAMRKLRAEHPSWTRDMSKLFGWITGGKVCSDAKRMMTVQSVMPQEETPTDNYALLKNQQRRSP